MFETGSPCRTRPVPRLLTPVSGVFLGALLLRWWVLWRATGVPYFVPDQGDMKFYSDWAQRIASGVWTDHQAFYGLPGYAYWLAGIYGAVGFQPFVAVAIQTVAEALTATVIFQIARLVCVSGASDKGTTGWGIAAAAGWVFFMPAQAFSVILMPTVFLVLTFWFVVWWVMMRATTPWRPRAALGLGTLVGVVAMAVANILFLIPLVLVSVFRNGRPAARSSRAWAHPAVAAFALLAGVGLGTAPCWLHNHFVAGEPVFLSAHGGLNFWIGNNPEANGYPKLPPGLRGDQAGMLRDSITSAEQAAGRPLRRAEVSAYWSAKADAYVCAHPGAWLQLLALKLRNVFNALQYDDLSIIAQLREDGVLLPGLSFGLVALLALPGAALAWRETRTSRWVIAAVALHVSSLLTVFVTERYRLAAVPGLLVLAVYGVRRVWQQGVIRRQGRYALAYAGLLVGSATLVFWPQHDPTLRVLDDYNTGLADISAGHLDRAQTKLEHVDALTPDNADIVFALGNLHLAKGNLDRAKGCYRRVLELNPNHPRALNNLGVLALQENRWALAERFFLRSLQSADDPSAKVNYLLAKARFEQRDFAGAQAAALVCLRTQPKLVECETLLQQIRQASISP